ncbi:MAG: imidazole glycerol phosphate synthase, glutamine amidotransferase subunit [Elusimicrobia bacterium RIFOXYD2_FULL_34_15]|nr:MAG: imidazole glycerol phosphate synthase, glutamine amidotransferase subunit [Elusimicrobia bacterium RIFOXYD2_FULL_34_15]
MITIVDYGMGNLRSVQKAFEYIGKKAVVTSNKKSILNSSLIVVPGVGSFDAAMNNLKKLKLVEVIKKVISEGKPYLGLCLGLQILFECSEEGNSRGLEMLRGKVEKFNFRNNLKIPHMGWNNIKLKVPATKPLAGPPKSQWRKIFNGIEDNSYFYFVHSYCVKPKDKRIISTTTDYGINFASSIFYKNIFATQFHPEKSQKNGLRLLKNYVNYTGN